MEDHLSGCPVSDLSGARVRREYHSGLTGLSVTDLDHRVRHRRRPQLILACGHGRTLYGKVEWYVDNGSGLGIKPCGPENGGAQCHREGLKWFHRSLSFSSYLFPQVLALRTGKEWAPPRPKAPTPPAPMRNVLKWHIIRGLRQSGAMRRQAGFANLQRSEERRVGKE